MISKPLMLKEWKANYKLLLLFAAVLSLYITVVIAMFDPKLGESLNLMAQSMPQIFAAFGMLEVGATLLEFIANYLYGFLLVVFPTVFIILTTRRLMANYVDKGSMAYLLSSGNQRSKIAVTQAVNLIFYLFLLTAYITFLSITVSNIMFKGQLDIKKFFIINIGVLGLYVLLSGLCFMLGCCFDDTKYSIGIGSGLIVFFILLQMISQVGEKFEMLKYFTPLTLFDCNKLILGQGAWQIAVLYGAGIGMYIFGIWIFCKRDICV